MAQTAVESGAEAEAEFIMKLMKPFLGTIMDLMQGILLHEPWVVCLGGKRVGKDCVYDDFKPDITAVTKHRKPNVYNFGHKM